jgi:F-type H+-transporting ATPase subunit gamma
MFARRLLSRGFAVSEKQIKTRIKVVLSIEKITKAMKMVATSKMKLDVLNLENGKGFGDKVFDTILKVDTFMQTRIPNEGHTPDITIIPFTSDRGLCGSVNTNVLREMKLLIPTFAKEKLNILPVGEKGVSTLIRKFPDLVSMSVSDIEEPLNNYNVMAVAEQIKKATLKKDKIILVYNEYKNSITFVTKKVEIMTFKRFSEVFKNLKKYDIECQESEKATILGLYDLYICSNLYHALLQSKASEQSSRMTAMENASKNAKELVEKLQLAMNKARQFHITMELMEIISGANSI